MKHMHIDQLEKDRSYLQTMSKTRMSAVIICSSIAFLCASWTAGFSSTQLSRFLGIAGSVASFGTIILVVLTREMTEARVKAVEAVIRMIDADAPKLEPAGREELAKPVPHP